MWARVDTQRPLFAVLIPIIALSIRPVKCVIEPTPACAMFSLSGFARA